VLVQPTAISVSAKSSLAQIFERCDYSAAQATRPMEDFDEPSQPVWSFFVLASPCRRDGGFRLLGMRWQ
jgi:hypothetical protein